MHRAAGRVPIFCFLSLLGAAVLAACSNHQLASSTSPATPGPTASANSPYPAVYKNVQWGSTVTVSFPSDCSMTLTTTGEPDYTPNAYYLAPTSGRETPVAYTATTHMPLAVVSYDDDIRPSLRGQSVTLNICPTRAASTTPTNLGAIGYLISGTAIFNPFEANGSTPAVADNASYTFTDSAGAKQTAWFLDACGSHSNGMTWHAHANPDCVTSQVDTSDGPSHIIGIALDGYPIYGGRDIDGNVIPVSALDACNGITSPTPEFPTGAYHYVLPIGVSTRQASINCYAGQVSTAMLAQGQKVACNMKLMFAMIRGRHADTAKDAKLPVRREFARAAKLNVAVSRRWIVCSHKPSGSLGPPHLKGGQFTDIQPKTKRSLMGDLF